VTEQPPVASWKFLSTEPGVHSTPAITWDGITGKGGGFIQKRQPGFCFEPQHYPDSPESSSQFRTRN